MRPVKLVTDSTSDLSEELIKQYDIAVVPLYVNFGTNSYKDNINIDTEELFRKVKENGKLPTTSSPTVADFTSEFAKYIDRGMDILHISISSKLSSSFQNACVAASQFHESRIKVVNSLNLSSGIGILVLTAAACVGRGLNLNDTLRTVQASIARVRVNFIIDTVEYLYKGGRCSGLQMLLSSLLEIHPIIRVTDGEMQMASKIRGNRQIVLAKLVKNTMDNLDSINPERIFITHIGSSEDASQIRTQITKLNKFKQILIMNTSCVISSHCGPKTIGIAYLEN